MAERAAQQANTQGNAQANAQANGQANAQSNAPGTGGAAAEMKGAEQPQAQTPPPQQRFVGPGIPQQIYLAEAKVRFDMALGAEIGFVERLVWFWSNHFCISADVVNNMSGGYEREAIRAHVLGRFGDMLQAAESHPAMLVYLDNFRSIGPMSVAGLINKTGLNENLARETLELHTLGVRTVYTQDDVYSLAKTITGCIDGRGNVQRNAPHCLAAIFAVPL